MAALDWSQCPAVESIPGKVSGAWVLRDTRMPISVIFENLEYGSSIEEIIENYGVTRDQIQAVLYFVAKSSAPPSVSFNQDPEVGVVRWDRQHSDSTEGQG